MRELITKYFRAISDELGNNTALEDCNVNAVKSVIGHTIEDDTFDDDTRRKLKLLSEFSKYIEVTYYGYLTDDDEISYRSHNVIPLDNSRL